MWTNPAIRMPALSSIDDHISVDVLVKIDDTLTVMCYDYNAQLWIATVGHYNLRHVSMWAYIPHVADIPETPEIDKRVPLGYYNT